MRCWQQCLPVDDLVHQAPVLRLYGCDLLPCHQDQFGTCGSNQRHKSARIRRLRKETQLHHRIKELCLGNSDPQIAGQNHSKCASSNGAVQSGDTQSWQGSNSTREPLPHGISCKPGTGCFQISTRAKYATRSGQDKKFGCLCGLGNICQFSQHFTRQRTRLVGSVNRDGPCISVFATADHIRPAFLRISSSRRLTSSPRYGSASGVHIHNSACAGHSGGIWTDQSS